jgi:integrase
MAYRIKKLPYKKRSWKVQYVSYKGGAQQTLDVPTEQWLSLGFRPDMTVEEARSRRDQLNAKEALDRRAAKRAAVQERLKDESLAHAAYLPPADVKEFEEKYLFRRGRRDKKESHWRAVKRTLCTLQIEPSEWEAEAIRFYDYFSGRSMSLSYVQKVIPILNQWGRFQAKKRGQFFAPLRAPRGDERRRITDAFRAKRGSGFASAPLTPEQLESARSKLLPRIYNWLALTVWFGLRPHEVDQLKLPQDEETWWIEDQEGTAVLCVFQTKLSAVEHEDKVKRIPAIFPQQQALLEVILGGDFKRPAAKTVRAHFGAKTNCYGGRKNFTDLMKGLGQKFEDVSKWLGHQDIRITHRVYTNKRKATWTPPPKKAA